jgi:outer membrane receptor for ferric coprogen and ferric-rhodotorulic acid
LVDRIGKVTLPEPTDYPDPILQTRLIDRLTRVYGAVHWNITDRLKGITGFAATWLKTTGYSYGVDSGRKNSKVTPYVGALVDITPNIKLYASYTGIFNPQSQVSIGNQRLAPSIDSGVAGTDGNDTSIRQRHYAVLDLMASIKVVDHVTAALNLRNVTSKKYLNSLAWNQAYYAELRTVLGSLSFLY